MDKKLNWYEERLIEEKNSNEMRLKYSKKLRGEKREIERKMVKAQRGCLNLENTVEKALHSATKLKPL